MKKLRAFTLMELLVGMVLSGIVVAACFTAYEVMAGRYGSYQRTNATIRDAAWLHGQLGKDFARAQLVTGTSEQIRLALPGQGSVQYVFSSSFVLRKDSLVTDTFHLPSTEVSLLMDHEAVKNEQQPVDELVLRTVINGEPEQLHFMKYYPADVRMAYARQQEQER